MMKVIPVHRHKFVVFKKQICQNLLNLVILRDLHLSLILDGFFALNAIS